MQELTSAVTDEEVIGFFMDVISRHVLRYQKPVINATSNLSMTAAQPITQGKDAFLNKLQNKLELAVAGDKEQVR